MNNKMKFHTKQKLPLHNLPFIGRVKGKDGLSFWDVPNSGGYGGGNTTGRALAGIYLRHLQQHGATPGGSLGSIAADMSLLGNDYSPDDDARRGQIIGFFNAIEPILAQLIKRSGIELTLSDVQLMKQANDGLDGHY